MSYSDTPPPPPAYGGQPGGYGGPPPEKNSGKAVAALVTGLVGLLTICCGLFVASGIAAVVLGFMARGEIRGSQGQLKGEGMAMAGIVLGFVEIGIFVLSIVLVATGVIDLTFTGDFE